MMRKLVALGLISLLAACDGGSADPDGGPTPGTDAGPMTGTDGGPSPGVDGGPTPGVDGGPTPGTDGGPTTPDGGPPPSGASPDMPGPLTPTTVEASVSSGTRTTPVVAYVPPGGPHPLVVFAPGLLVPSSGYDPLCDRLASHGFVVVRADPEVRRDLLGLLPDPDHIAMRDDLIAVIDWATGTAPFASQVDTSRVGVMGHSLGGKLSTMVTIQDARVGAQLGIDPVDGAGASPSADRPDIVPSMTAGIAHPVGFIGETVNAMASGGPFAMACAPADQNFQRFYEGTTGASWAAEWDVLNADHMDFVWDRTGCAVCDICRPEGTADPNAVRAATMTLTVAFFRRHLGAETAMEPWLTGASVPAGINTRSR